MLIRGELVRFLLDALSPRIDGDALCRAAGITYGTLQEPLCRVPSERVTAALASAEAACGDPLLGLRAAGHHGSGCMVRYLAISQETLGDGLAALCRFAPLLVTGDELSLEDGALLLWPRIDSRHLVESWLAVISREARAATGEAQCIDGIRLRHQPAAAAAQYEDAFGCPVHFGQRHDAIVFAGAALAVPLRRRNAAIARDLDAVATVELTVQRSASVAQRVALLLRAGLSARQECGRTAIAARLLLTSRTLQRHLDREGVSFNQVADRVRRELALELTSAPELDLASVATRCGFSSVSAFNKAFRRWTGSPPSAFRRAHSK